MLPSVWKLWPAAGATLAGAGTEGPLVLRPVEDLSLMLGPAPQPCPVPSPYTGETTQDIIYN